MWTAIKIAIYVLIHSKNWCKHWHTDKPLEWRHGCPMIDRIILMLYPMYFCNEDKICRMIEGINWELENPDKCYAKSVMELYKSNEAFKKV